MKRLIPYAAALAALAAFAAPALPAQAADYAWPVVRVIDGDTIVVDASADMPAEVAELRVRLRGVDAPETGHRARCDAERAAADQTTTFVEGLVAAATSVVVRDPEWGKWGGRVVADVVLDDDRSLATLLIDFSHGRPYDGGARSGWCGAAEFEAAGRTLLCATVDDAAARLACYDRAAVREGRDAPAARGQVAGSAEAEGVPLDYRAEFWRHIVDPCIAYVARHGTFDPAIVGNRDERAIAAAMRSMATARMAGLAEQVEQWVAGKDREFRMTIYAGFRAVCISEMQKKI